MDTVISKCDKVAGVALLLMFILIIIVYLFFTVKGIMQQAELKNFYNYISTVSIILTMINHIVVFSYLFS